MIECRARSAPAPCRYPPHRTQHAARIALKHEIARRGHDTRSGVFRKRLLPNDLLFHRIVGAQHAEGLRFAPGLLFQLGHRGRRPEQRPQSRGIVVAGPEAYDCESAVDVSATATCRSRRTPSASRASECRRGPCRGCTPSETSCARRPWKGTPGSRRGCSRHPDSAWAVPVF